MSNQSDTAFFVELRSYQKQNHNLLKEVRADVKEHRAHMEGVEQRVVSLETSRAVANSHFKIVWAVLVVVLAAFLGAFFTNYYAVKHAKAAQTKSY